MKNIEPNDAFEKIKDFILIDVRTGPEHDSQKIKDSINIDVSAPAFTSLLDGLDKSKKYLVYCRTGERSSYAQMLMQRRGFDDVANLEGGILFWDLFGLPTETSEQSAI